LARAEIVLGAVTLVCAVGALTRSAPVQASSATAFGETSGLLTDTYQRKPSFIAYGRLIARCGARA
jgi:hypothetical protein